MAKAYTPGLLVTGFREHRCRRILPIAGEVNVSIGDVVTANDVVAETNLPGDVNPVNLANQLSMPASDVMDCVVVNEGDTVAVGDVIAQTKGIFGFMKTSITSKVAGTVETISPVTGQMIVRGAPLPVQVRAYISGQVVNVLPGEGCEIEANVAYVQGIFGVGGETAGSIKMACSSHDEELDAHHITEDMAGAVVVGGARMTAAAVARAREVAAAAIVSGGIDDADLKDMLGYDLGVAITGREQLGITVIVTEGFGEIAMAARTFELLKSYAGTEASVNGATQIRAGVMRPEIVIPLESTPEVGDGKRKYEEGQLEIGRPVRVIRDPYFGIIGEVSDLPSEPHVLGSGSKARVLEVKLPTGEHAIVPRANVELIEE
ncbi:MAG: hypothetical protein MK074_00995 [Phycisphaerales bacterium]|nr:hypothetical protein [Phycisphaerales bacterium]